jgi:Tfp pilus assembly protein PilP
VLQDLDDKKLLEKPANEWLRFRFTQISDNNTNISWENAIDDLDKYINGLESSPKKAADQFRKLIRLEKTNYFTKGKRTNLQTHVHLILVSAANTAKTTG